MHHTMFNINHSLTKDLSISQNDVSIVLIDANDDLCIENNDEADFGKKWLCQFCFSKL